MLCMKHAIKAAILVHILLQPSLRSPGGHANLKYAEYDKIDVYRHLFLIEKINAPYAAIHQAHRPKVSGAVSAAISARDAQNMQKCKKLMLKWPRKFRVSDSLYCTSVIVQVDGRRCSAESARAPLPRGRDHWQVPCRPGGRAEANSESCEPEYVWSMTQAGPQ